MKPGGATPTTLVSPVIDHIIAKAFLPILAKLPGDSAISARKQAKFHLFSLVQTVKLIGH